MSIEIACIGEPLIELNQQADIFYKPGIGGDTLNCAVAAARQGTKVAYITNLGKDDFGNTILNLLHEEGINADNVKQIADANTGIYFVTHSAEGHEFTYYRKNSASTKLTPNDLNNEILSKVKILHISGISQAISESARDTINAAIGIVIDAGGKISYDINLRNKLWDLDVAKEVINATINKCDILLPSIDEARVLTNLENEEAILDYYLEQGVEIIALSQGPKGTYVATNDKRELIETPTVEVIDATAAGDTFDGVYLSQLLINKDPFTAAKFANFAAALSTQGYGAIEPIPTKEEVEAFICN